MNMKLGKKRSHRARLLLVVSAVGLAAFTSVSRAEGVIDLDTTTIMGNSELPKSLYVVPWQDRQSVHVEEQTLRLHNLYGELFDPVMPAYIPPEVFELKPEPDEKTLLNR